MLKELKCPVSSFYESESIASCCSQNTNIVITSHSVFLHTHSTKINVLYMDKNEFSWKMCKYSLNRIYRIGWILTRKPISDQSIQVLNQHMCESVITKEMSYKWDDSDISIQHLRLVGFVAFCLRFPVASVQTRLHIMWSSWYTVNVKTKVVKCYVVNFTAFILWATVSY